jgi:hypothetical protein
MKNATDQTSLMQTVLTVLRFLLGIIAGLIGFMFLLNAPYQLLNANFRFADGGPFIIVSVIAEA